MIAGTVKSMTETLKPSICQGLTTPSIYSTKTSARASRLDDTESNFVQVMSNDPRFIGLSNTPTPVVCEFCGAERYTEGIKFGGSQIIWFPVGANPCSCDAGQSKYKREQAELDSQHERQKKGRADMAMREKVNRLIGASGIGERFLHSTFQTFCSDSSERSRIAKITEDYARKFEEKLPKYGKPLPSYNGFLITGGIGIGKTHIASAIANYLIAHGTAVICMTERNLLGKIRDTYSGGSESTVRDLYSRVPLLIIDDLGKGKATEWSVSTLYDIIDGRYERAMPLIITTNYNAQSLIERLTPTGADNTTAIAIIDRLAEMCASITMNGESRRGKRVIDAKKDQV